eukprot:CAMPEP_0197450098 /NCGR_PEP_ID=MMETSP1175-20131217/24006_1 /TAXON_ID=1003142 /ORGANISM="Triceratium dubium, Strain CCMP147" /LENGTH=68 /DNA_ID=CAMNT_0042982441 /DNA_START=8 /DNA_END=211 /DNA_ORIENTATION=+
MSSNSSNDPSRPSRRNRSGSVTHRYSRLTFGAYNAKDPVKYAGVSTPVERRKALGIRGLVPPAYVPLE